MSHVVFKMNKYINRLIKMHYYYYYHQFETVNRMWVRLEPDHPTGLRRITELLDMTV